LRGPGGGRKKIEAPPQGHLSWANFEWGAFLTAASFPAGKGRRVMTLARSGGGGGARSQGVEEGASGSEWRAGGRGAGSGGVGGGGGGARWGGGADWSSNRGTSGGAFFRRRRFAEKLGGQRHAVIAWGTFGPPGGKPFLGVPGRIFFLFFFFFFFFFGRFFHFPLFFHFGGVGPRRGRGVGNGHPRGC